MGDIALVLGGVAAVITALGTAIAAVITALRASPRERQRAARGALDRLAAVAADGEITQEELQEVLGELVVRPDEDEKEQR